MGGCSAASSYGRPLRRGTHLHGLLPVMEEVVMMSDSLWSLWAWKGTGVGEICRVQVEG